MSKNKIARPSTNNKHDELQVHEHERRTIHGIVAEFQSITESLLINGINLFQDSYKSVLDTIDEKVSKLIKK